MDKSQNNELEDKEQDETEALFSEEDFDLILYKATRKLDDDDEMDGDESPE